MNRFMGRDVADQVAEEAAEEAANQGVATARNGGLLAQQQAVANLGNPDYLYVFYNLLASMGVLHSHIYLGVCLFSTDFFRTMQSTTGQMATAAAQSAASSTAAGAGASTMSVSATTGFVASSVTAIAA
jgi:hypothetical protein